MVAKKAAKFKKVIVVKAKKVSELVKVSAPGIRPRMPKKPKCESIKETKIVYFSVKAKRGISGISALDLFKHVPENIPLDQCEFRITYPKSSYYWNMPQPTIEICKVTKVANPEYETVWTKYNEDKLAYKSRLSAWNKKYTEYQKYIKEKAIRDEARNKSIAKIARLLEKSADDKVEKLIKKLKGIE